MSGPVQPPVEFRVGLGSCGIANGARPVHEAVESAVHEAGAGRVKAVGCGGSCHREPLLEGQYRNDAPRFRPASWAHFRDQRSAGDFADYGAEIQVDDFLIAETVASP